MTCISKSYGKHKVFIRYWWKEGREFKTGFNFDTFPNIPLSPLLPVSIFVIRYFT